MLLLAEKGDIRVKIPVLYIEPTKECRIYEIRDGVIFSFNFM